VIAVAALSLAEPGVPYESRTASQSTSNVGSTQVIFPSKGFELRGNEYAPLDDHAAAMAGKM